ncbi:MAG: head GIN domain-containing protein [Sphingomicrobium sp.]
MRPALPLLAGAALLIGGCHLFGRDQASGPHATRDYPVGAFTGIAVAGAYEVEVRTGSAPSVHAEGGQNRLDKMAVRVDGDTLHIEPVKSMHLSWRDDDKVKLVVTVPMLAAADIAGSGDVRVDHVAGPAFKGSIAGSGNLRLDRVETASLDLDIAGSGDITAAGKSESVKYDITGSGDIDAERLIAQTAAVSITGSGGVHAHATGTASVEVMGSGDVIVTGGAKCTVAKTGSGDIRCS